MAVDGVQAVGSPGRLELMSADLERMGSFDEAVARCDYVCHVASPVKLKVSGADMCNAIPYVHRHKQCEKSMEIINE